MFSFFNDTATTEIYTLSLHDALPICPTAAAACESSNFSGPGASLSSARPSAIAPEETTSTSRLPLCRPAISLRSEEHTSELQSRQYLVCRLLLEKKKIIHLLLFHLYL